MRKFMVFWRIDDTEYHIDTFDSLEKAVEEGSFFKEMTEAEEDSRGGAVYVHEVEMIEITLIL